MTDLSQGEATNLEAVAGAPTPSAEITFALKNGAGEVSVDTSKLPDDVYREALMQGIKVLAERAMSKITKAAYPDEAERKAAIHAKALVNIEDMYAGKTKITGQKAVKVSGVVKTEAMRLARNLVKDAIKRANKKISHYKASEITTAAKALLEQSPEILATAEANLKAREAAPAKINVMSLIKEDPALVAKAEADNAKKKANKPLSAKQAGKVQPRTKGAKGGQGQQATA